MIQAPIRYMLLALTLPALLIPGTRMGTPNGAAAPGSFEPGAGLDVGATLVEVTDTGGAPVALVRLDITSRLARLDASVETPGRYPATRILLDQGKTRSLLLRVDVEAGRENHLFFTVKGRGHDGASQNTTAYLRVNLDERLDPVLNGEYLEYQGAAAPEVEP